MKIQREIIDDLKQWKDDFYHKPIVLRGPRGVGKSWIMHELGSECFDNVAEFNFETMPELSSFNGSMDFDNMVKEIQMFCNVPVRAGETLIIFDEIQECSEVLKAIATFSEYPSKFHVIAASSLFNPAIKHENWEIDTKKVDIIDIHPVSFKEFLGTVDKRTCEYAENLGSIMPLPTLIMNKLRTEHLRYMLCGGMPAATSALLDDKGMASVDEALQNVLNGFKLDSTKFCSPSEIPHISEIWNSLPAQLVKSSKKFQYKVIKASARAREYENAVQWLDSTGMICMVFNLKEPKLPMSGNIDVSSFKAYPCDCGILRRMAGIAPEMILGGGIGYTEFRGIIAETAVLQSLISRGKAVPCYWSPKSRAEVDFAIEINKSIVPVEVKADTKVAGKSLSVYAGKYNSPLRVRFTSNNLKFSDGLLNIPIPLADWTPKLVQASLFL
ncbi:MAG: ATP-binding protein [Muribaculaceae bacterium]|jgi:uncharacterized protein|nr:ATP-binding protein [Muribaculaceae bacterium]